MEVINIANLLGINTGSIPDTVKQFDRVGNLRLDGVRKILVFPKSWVHPSSYFYRCGLVKVCYFDLNYCNTFGKFDTKLLNQALDIAKETGAMVFRSKQVSIYEDRLSPVQLKGFTYFDAIIG